MENSRAKLDIVSQNAVSVGYNDTHFGLATTADQSITLPRSTTLSLSHQLSFLWAEYILGVLFVAFSTLFILVMPSALTKPGSLNGLLSRGTKRSMDIVGSIAGLILTLPLWIIVPILIKLDSHGPVFYSQIRVGMNHRRYDRRYHQQVDSDEARIRERRRDNNGGSLFNVLKFRTMVQDAEKKCGPVWATRNDPRITRLGNFMRKTRIDEIPQFINILIGDMSLVGPRPERPNFVEELSQKVDNYSRRLLVKPGLTGLAQVENGYDSSIASVAEKVRLDLTYINRWSVWLDLHIILKTFKVVFTGRGAL
jgi:lipopolysaccharide/colanic/teichoic acid biosynthesis glycosyltransferase